MKRLYIAAIISLAVFISAGAQVSFADTAASGINCSASVNGDMIILEGKTSNEEPFSEVGVYVLKYGETLSEKITAEEIISKTLYAMQQTTGADRSFSFEINMEGNQIGRYNAVISDGTYKTDVSFVYASEKEKTRLLKNINEIESGEEIAEYIDISSKESDSVFIFGLNDDIIFASDSGKVLEYFASLNKTDKINPEDPQTFTDKLTAAAVMSALDSGKEADLAEYAALLMLDSAYMNTYTEKLSAEEVKKLCNAFEGKGICTFKEFGETFENNIILCVINNVSSWSDTDYIIRNHGEDIGINVASYNLFSKNRQLASALGEKSPYDSIDEFVAEYKRQYNKLSSASGSSGGSSGGGGGGGAGGSAAFSGPVDDTPVSSEVFSENCKSSSFSDIDDVPWAVEYIGKLSEKGIINGTGNGLFSPSREITREELVKILVSAFKLEGMSGEIGFTDVDKNQWYYEYIVAAYSNGIVNGYEDNTFGTGKSISREEMVTLSYRAACLLGYKFDVEEKSSFADEPEISGYAYEAVTAFKNAGIVEGFSDNSFDPKGNLTRAQATKIICLLMEYGGAV